MWCYTYHMWIFLNSVAPDLQTIPWIVMSHSMVDAYQHIKGCATSMFKVEVHGQDVSGEVTMHQIHFLDHMHQPLRWRQYSLQNISIHPPYYMTQQGRKPQLLSSPLWKPQISHLTWFFFPKMKLLSYDVINIPKYCRCHF
jgi:hypothetical protein